MANEEKRPDKQKATEIEREQGSKTTVNAPDGQFGVVGDNAHIEGGINFIQNITKYITNSPPKRASIKI